MLIIQILLFLLIGYSAYMFVLVVSGLFYKPAPANTRSELPRIKIFLPAYKPDDAIVEVMERLRSLSQGQPVDVFILFQYADSKYLQAAARLGFAYEEKTFEHLNGNSYQHALKYLTLHHLPKDGSDYVMILDKDNLLAKDYFKTLQKVNLSSYDLVQSVRMPITIGKDLQVYDACSERLNDLMLRAGKCYWGGHPELSGSAALIKRDIFRHCIESLDPKAPGFDKNFMVNLLSGYRTLKTMFAEDLVIYEEKTAAVSNYDAQRLRWFGEQYYNAFFKARTLWLAALKGNLHCLDYWVSLIRPPRVVLFIMSFLLAALDLWDGQPGMLSIAFVLNALTFLFVSFPYLDQIEILNLAKGGWNILRSNVRSALTSLQKKHLGTFIHTR